MELRIADTFTDSLARLTGEEQKATKITAFDLQLNPALPELQFHRLDKAKDHNFWSVRVPAPLSTANEPRTCRIATAAFPRDGMNSHNAHHLSPQQNIRAEKQVALLKFFQSAPFTSSPPLESSRLPKSNISNLLQLSELTKNVPVPLGQ